MRRRSLRVWLAGIFVLACSAGGLALVSVSHAGSTVGSSFDFSVQPSVLSTSGTGFAKAVFTAASGAGTGSATHVVITFRLPSALTNPSGTTSDCTVAAGSGENVVTCNLGTINAGQTVKRFVTFTAPSSVASPPAVFNIDGRVSWDNGSGGAGGGGGVNSFNRSAQTAVYPATNTRHAGNCFLSGHGTVSTAPVSDTDNQATSAEIGAAAPFLGLPCSFADVGEDPAPAGSGFLTDISHNAIPQLSEPATITLTLNSLPIPFSKFSWLFSPDYPATLPSQPIGPCVNGQLPANTMVCQLTAVKNGRGGTWTFKQLGTGTDPAYGR